MTKKNAIISAIFLLILFAVSLYFFIRTDNSAVTALSLFGIVITGFSLFILFIYFAANINNLPLEQRLVATKKLLTSYIATLALCLIVYTVWVLVEESEESIFRRMYVSFPLYFGLIGFIMERRKIGRELSKLSELDRNGYTD